VSQVTGYHQTNYEARKPKTWFGFSFKQEHGYRKQIAHRLHTWYIDGINNNPVTLKSGLRITQGQWKWNHWTAHTRHTISWVIWQWILSWS